MTTDRRWRVRVTLPPDSARFSWWREQWRRHPRTALALRAALAASLAWMLVGYLPGPAADYPYYAPFGAIVATTFSLAGSVRDSVQAVGAIAVGGAVGWCVDHLPVSGPVAIACVVVPSVVLAGWRVLGPMGGWVPTSALFALIIGNTDGTYAGAYAGLTGVGALVGIGVNAILPPLPLAPAQAAARAYRAALAVEIKELADLLDEDELPALADWEQAQAATPRQRAGVHTAVAEVRQAAHRNRRARRYSTSIDALLAEARTLERLALTVNDITDLLLGEVAADTVDRSDVLTPEVRERFRTALRTIAEALENTTVAGTADAHVGEDEEPLSSAHAVEAVEDARDIAPRRDDQLLVDGLFVSLKRAADSLAEIERTD